MGSSPKGENITDDSKYTEFHQGKLYFTDDIVKSSNQYTKEITKLADPNSVLLCVRAPVGEVNLTDRLLCIGRGLAAIKGFSNIQSDFLFFGLSALKNDLLLKATGTTFVAVTNDVVKNQLIPLPPLSQQVQISLKIKKLYSALKKIEESLSN